jgi:hypothetical protein
MLVGVLGLVFQALDCGEGEITVMECTILDGDRRALAVARGCSGGKRHEVLLPRVPAQGGVIGPAGMLEI